MLNINKLTLADIKQINALLKQLSENSPVISKKDLKYIAKNNGMILVIRNTEDNSKIIGMATLFVFPPMTGKRGTIEDVVVDEAHRGKGLGERLVCGLIERARELGVHKLDLTSAPKRVAANTLYQKLGFEKRETNVYRMVL